MYERVVIVLGEFVWEDVGGSGWDDFGYWVKIDLECKLYIYIFWYFFVFYYNIVL